MEDLNFNPLGTNWDPVGTGGGDGDGPSSGPIQKTFTHKIHIRVQQRKKNCYITTISNMDEDLDLKRICRAMRNAFSCNGTVIADKEHGEIIQLTGDQRDNLKTWLVDVEILTAKEAKERLVLHGA
jgi:translation initiation factor 1